LNGTIIFESNLKGQFEFESNLDALQVPNTQKVDMFSKVIISFKKNASQLGPLQIDRMFTAAVYFAGTELEMHISLHCLSFLHVCMMLNNVMQTVMQGSFPAKRSVGTKQWELQED